MDQTKEKPNSSQLELRTSTRMAVCIVLSALFLLILAPANAAGILVPDNGAATVAAREVISGEKIRLEPSLSQAVWREAPIYEDFLERSPKYGALPAYKTRLRVLYDEQAIYFGIDAFDPDPKEIRAPLVRHDTVYLTQDFVALYIDPTGQKKSAQFFRVNASGSKADGLYTNDDNQDFSPDYNFESAVVRNEGGYSAIIRVPFSSLRYAKDSTQPWRMMIMRNVPRDQFHKITSVPVPLDSASFIDSMQPIGGLDAPSSAGLELRPNLTFGAARAESNEQATRTRSSYNVGLDFKWQVNSEWVVDGTINPDFSQIELDTPQLSGNTQFALFVPEKRPFFLESADLLRSPTKALYTRTITDPRWGLRSTFRTDHAAGTAFILRDEGGGRTLIPDAYSTGKAVQPASTIAGTRLLRIHDGSAVGALATIREYENGRGSNAVVGADFTVQSTRAWRLSGEWLSSSASAFVEPDGQLARGSSQYGSSLHLEAQRKTERAESDFTYQDITANFRNDTGFLWQSNIRRLATEQSLIYRNIGPVNELELQLSAEKVVARDTGDLVSDSIVPGVSVSGPRNSFASLQYFGWTRTRLAPRSILLNERYWRAELSMTPTDRVSLLSIGVDIGDLADTNSNSVRPGQRVSAELSFRPLLRLEVEAKISAAALDNENDRIYNEVASQLLAIWHFTPAQTLRLIWQRSSLVRHFDDGPRASDDQENTASLTYAFRKSAGTTFYAGLSRNRYVNEMSIPAAVETGTELFLKFQLALGK